MLRLPSTTRSVIVVSSSKCSALRRDGAKGVVRLDLGRRSMMSDKKAKKSKAGTGGGRGIDQKTTKLLKLVDAKPRPM